VQSEYMKGCPICRANTFRGVIYAARIHSGDSFVQHKIDLREFFVERKYTLGSLRRVQGDFLQKNQAHCIVITPLVCNDLHWNCSAWGMLTLASPPPPYLRAFPAHFYCMEKWAGHVAPSPQDTFHLQGLSPPSLSSFSFFIFPSHTYSVLLYAFSHTSFDPLFFCFLLSL